MSPDQVPPVAATLLHLPQPNASNLSPEQSSSTPQRATQVTGPSTPTTHPQQLGVMHQQQRAGCRPTSADTAQVAPPPLLLLAEEAHTHTQRHTHQGQSADHSQTCVLLHSHTKAVLSLGQSCTPRLTPHCLSGPKQLPTFVFHEPTNQTAQRTVTQTQPHRCCCSPAAAATARRSDEQHLLLPYPARTRCPALSCLASCCLRQTPTPTPTVRHPSCRQLPGALAPASQPPWQHQAAPPRPPPPLGSGPRPQSSALCRPPRRCLQTAARSGAACRPHPG